MQWGIGQAVGHCELGGVVVVVVRVVAVEGVITIVGGGLAVVVSVGGIVIVVAVATAVSADEVDDEVEAEVCVAESAAGVRAVAGTWAVTELVVLGAGSKVTADGGSEVASCSDGNGGAAASSLDAREGKVVVDAPPTRRVRGNGEVGAGNAARSCMSSGSCGGCALSEVTLDVTRFHI